MGDLKSACFSCEKYEYSCFKLKWISVNLLKICKAKIL